LVIVDEFLRFGVESDSRSAYQMAPP
jgi:hypothetical protein